jgi:hypothetical protein
MMDSQQRLVLQIEQHNDRIARRDRGVLMNPQRRNLRSPCGPMRRASMVAR